MALKAHIVATLEDGTIGINNDLPWNFFKSDMMFFRDKTMGHTVIMGYNTLVSLPKKLEGRYTVGIADPNRVAVPLINIADDLYSSYAEAMTHQQATCNEDIIFVAGGAKLYQQSLSDMDIVYRNVIVNAHLKNNEQDATRVYYPVVALEKLFVKVNEEVVGDKLNTHMIKQVWVRRKC